MLPGIILSFLYFSPCDHQDFKSQLLLPVDLLSNTPPSLYFKLNKPTYQMPHPTCITSSSSSCFPHFSEWHFTLTKAPTIGLVISCLLWYQFNFSPYYLSTSLLPKSCHSSGFYYPQFIKSQQIQVPSLSPPPSATAQFVPQGSQHDITHYR